MTTENQEKTVFYEYQNHYTIDFYQIVKFLYLIPEHYIIKPMYLNGRIKLKSYRF
ncbi:hypothetical protein [Okeania sp. KiyG1]|uniref:hypothetical protein n=1 Tax=Okeania sp. KiyG1 TaxID=2720165 RepID=UPI001920B327|nr:hypothetical protein [Okeania sp. KiyG1]